MSQDWISAKFGAAVYRLTQSDHPAWIWSADGDADFWHNRAARWFKAGHKSGSAKPAGLAHPIKGQIKRLLRLGFVGVPSLARVQMLVDKHPVSQTCRCTPIVLAGGEPALLVVSADAVDLNAVAPAGTERPIVDRLLPHLGAYALVDENQRVLSGSPSGIIAAQADLPVDTQNDALDGGLKFVVFAKTGDETATDAAPSQSAETSPVPPDVEVPQGAEQTPHVGRLTNLMERFDTQSSLYDPLGPEDDVLPDALIPHEGDGPVEGSFATENFLGPDDSATDPDDIADLEMLDTQPEDLSIPDETIAPEAKAEPSETDPVPHPVQWRVTGRGFVAETATDGGEQVAEISGDAEAEALHDVPDEELDQAARYNFDELARILTDRVAGETPPPAGSSSAPAAEPRSEARTLSLSDEHLVLNRLPLGILVFRDQDIVFANRAMADLLACASIAELRDRGLDAIFPRVGVPGVSPGPVAALLDSHGTHVPVSARLQAISWHGGPALMLSARREDSSPSGETLVRNFVETLAASRGDGFVEISRAGVIEVASARAAALLDGSDEIVTGRALASFVAPPHIPELQSFLEKPARRAGIDRPNLRIETTTGAELSLFTEGSAGIVTGYFGLVSDMRPASKSPAQGHAALGKIDPALLARMSRGLRRPLNTIVGFSQLLENQAFGALGNPRYLEYARDIQSAGLEIAGLVDELDQFGGLQKDEFSADASDFSLDALLSECERVVRHQAGRRQVFVRSAISEHLPFIRADRTLMRQALLNLLASAIDQTPQGGKVILSAQVEDDGGVSIHVRDSGKGGAELSERFAVFREGSARQGEAMVPMKSSIGLALTRSLLAVNSCSLTIDPSSGIGTLMSLRIPADLTRAQQRHVD